MKFVAFVLVFFSIFLQDMGFVNLTNKKVEYDLPIIMYHSVYPKRNNAYVISPDKFENDLKFLKENKFTPIFMSELIDFTEGNFEMPKKPIILTFDDGYYNNYSIVYPLLKKYNFKAVISLVGTYCDKETKNEGQNAFYSNLSWGEVSEMSETPYFEFQNHSNNMHSLSFDRKGIAKKFCESDEEYKVNLKNDAMLCSKKVFEATSKFPNTFCFPFGIYNSLAIETLKECGFKAFLNCEEKVNKISVGCNLDNLHRFNRTSWNSVENIINCLQ